MTPGCFTEACDFRDNMARLQKLGIKVFGVSPDPIARHEKFIAKHDLNFTWRMRIMPLPVLGVWGPKKFMGLNLMVLSERPSWWVPTARSLKNGVR